MKIAVTSTAFAKSPELVAYLEQHFTDYVLNHTGHLLNDDELAEFACGCDGMILALDAMHTLVLRRVPDFKVITKCGAGLDNISLDACCESG